MSASNLPVATDRQTWNGLKRAFSVVKGMTVALLLLSLGEAAAALITPYAASRVVGALDEGVLTSDLAMKWGTIAVAGALLSVAFSFSVSWISRIWAEKVSQRLRDDLTDAAFALPMRTIENTPVGDLTARAASDIGWVAKNLRDYAPGVLRAVIIVVVYAVAVVVIAPSLWVSLVLVAVLLPGPWQYNFNRARPAYLAERTIDAELADGLSETARAARTIEALSAAPQRIHGVDDGSREMWRSRMRTLWLRSVLFPGVELSMRVPHVVAFAYGGWLVIEGRLGLAALSAASLYLLRMAGPLFWLTDALDAIQNSWAAASRVVGVGQAEPAPAPTTQVPKDATIRVHNVSFCYGPDLPMVLRNVDLTIRPGQRLALVGPSGAGKSTLGRLLAGFDMPTEGAVTIGGAPIGMLPVETLARQVLMVTQDHHMFAGTLRDNVTLAAPDATDEEVTRALKTVGADLAALPDGVRSVVGVGGVDTEGALAQQVALARVLLAGPKVVVLDEATSLLSPATARHAEHDLNAALEGRTVIAIAHRLNTAHDADRIGVVDGGKIVELGSHAELMGLDGLYARLWRTWHGNPDG